MDGAEGERIERCQLVVDLGRILYIDRVGVVPTHQAMVPVFAAGLEGEYELSTDEGKSRYRTWIAPPNLVRSVDAFERPLAVMPIDPVSAPAAVRSPDRCLAALDRLRSGFDAEAWIELSHGVGMVETVPGRPEPLIEAMRLVRQSSDENVPSGEIAAEVGYSLSHLQHLFRTHIGTSIRSYRTWSRFVSMTAAYASTGSLTDAAVAAGFFDSAHLTHAFTATFGVLPSLVFNGEAEIHVVQASD